MGVSAIVVPIVALLVGVGIGNSGEDEPSEADATKAAADVKVVEKIVEKKVEVPGPERKVEVKVVPQGCLDAIAEARGVAAGVSRFAEAAGIYPPLVGRAFEAGIAGDTSEAQDVIDEMERANGGMQDATEKTGPHVEAFNKAAEACKV